MPNLSSRPKKTSITRTRNGCHNCRRRRVKCDQRRPHCNACVRLALDCEGYNTRPRFQFHAQTGKPVEQTVRFAEWGPIYVPGSRSGGSPPSKTRTPTHAASPVLSSVFFTPYPDIVVNAPSTPETFENSAEIECFRLKGIASVFNCASATLYDKEPSCVGEKSYLLDLAHPTTLFPTSLASNNSKCMDEIYWHHWRTRVVEFLPQVFDHITATPPQFIPLKNVLLAVSSIHFARSVSSAVGEPGLQPRREAFMKNEHRLRSLNYYSTAMRLLADVMPTASADQAQDVFATLLLFHFVELDIGSFSGVLTHMDGMDKVLPFFRDQLTSTQLGKRLLSTWLTCRSLVVNRRISLAFADARHEVPSLWRLRTVDAVEDTLTALHTTSDTIIMILCEGIELSRKIILDFAVCRDIAFAQEGNRHPNFCSMLKHAGLPMSRSGVSQPELAAISEAYQNSLSDQRGRLEHWYSQLDDAELPIACSPSRPQHSRTIGGALLVPALKLRTHNSAMDYAYYAAARLLCSTDFWERIVDDQTSATTSLPSITEWELLILRIAAGLSFQDCDPTSKSSAIGIGSLLGFCAGWCPDRAVGNWVESYIRRLDNFGIEIDGTFPNSIVLRNLQEVIAMKQQSRDCYILSLLEPTNLDRDEIYRPGAHFGVAMCGKDWNTGLLWNSVLVLSL
ncbi:uncharacterized protein PV06_03449 [Exophiala oligosperma]|uniref:Zn(2)-C6 fungal-type domain-containing protein n=1 Tax=Exophiala oligosperma TaxID=215243 RepID=A0A0D2AYZ9_9EURO|nr:uncharacterized protein PV06_03449 [Exophiala oligosperma]KIW45026.1 hypothetical protein PV06_03449 [Exophiala oligosperma]